MVQNDAVPSDKKERADFLINITFEQLTQFAFNQHKAGEFEAFFLNPQINLRPDQNENPSPSEQVKFWRSKIYYKMEEASREQAASLLADINHPEVLRQFYIQQYHGKDISSDSLLKGLKLLGELEPWPETALLAAKTIPIETFLENLKDVHCSDPVSLFFQLKPEEKERFLRMNVLGLIKTESQGAAQKWEVNGVYDYKGSTLGDVLLGLFPEFGGPTQQPHPLKWGQFYRALFVDGDATKAKKALDRVVNPNYYFHDVFNRLDRLEKKQVLDVLEAKLNADQWLWETPFRYVANFFSGLLFILSRRTFGHPWGNQDRNMYLRKHLNEEKQAFGKQGQLSLGDVSMQPPGLAPAPASASASASAPAPGNNNGCGG